MKAKRNHTGVFEFLKASGVLETGSKDVIDIAKREYMREYKRKWIMNKRKEEKQVTIFLNSKEYKLISKSANAHKRNTTQYIKEAALAYSKRQYINPDPLITNYIREALALNYNAIAHLEEGNVISAGMDQKLLAKLECMEQMIMEKLINPKEVEQALIEAVANNPGQKAHFLELLENL